jgi:hypothetical protein
MDEGRKVPVWLRIISGGMAAINLGWIAMSSPMMHADAEWTDLHAFSAALAAAALWIAFGAIRRRG